MKKVLFSMVCLVLLATTGLNAETDTAKRWSGFSLNELETSSNRVFDLLDADKNGSITLDEIDLLKEDSEEPLSEEELVLRQRRLNLIGSYFWTEEEIETFSIGDTNGDGSMNKQEYDNLESNVRTHVLELGLQSLDNDKNGSVEANEFGAHLTNFEEWDTNSDGTIDREEIAGITDRRLLAEIRRRWAEREDRGEEARERRAAERERRAAIEREQSEDDD